MKVLYFRTRGSRTLEGEFTCKILEWPQIDVIIGQAQIESDNDVIKLLADHSHDPEFKFILPNGNETWVGMNIKDMNAEEIFDFLYEWYLK